MEKLFKNVVVLLCIFTLIGCSSEDVKGTESLDDKKEKAKIPTKVEDMIAQGSGKYAGDNYNEEKVRAELDRIVPMRVKKKHIIQ